jgi:hypothetical protein
LGVTCQEKVISYRTQILNKCVPYFSLPNPRSRCVLYPLATGSFFSNHRMRVIKTMRRQTAIYWKRSGIDEYGRPVFDPPILILCRWDSYSPQTDINETQDNSTNPQTVYPDRVLEVGSYLMLGTKAVLDTLTTSPPNIPTAYIIKAQKVNPTWKFQYHNTAADYQSEHVMIEITL